MWVGEFKMKNTAIIFLISALVGLGGGYLFFQVTNDSSSVANPAEQSQENVKEEKEDVTTTSVVAEGDILNAKGCLACHAVSDLGLEGGVTGPDLSNAFTEVEGKHGKPLEEYLKEPTSAVMSSVIGGNPLTDEEIKQIVDALEIASQK